MYIFIMKINEFLKAWRVREELTIGEASKRLKIPWDTYRRIEMGAAMSPETFLAVLVYMIGD